MKNDLTQEMVDEADRLLNESIITPLKKSLAYYR